MKTLIFAVNGTLMRGFELEKNLINSGAAFLKESKTAPCYRLWSIDDNNPAMIRTSRNDEKAVSVDVELWKIPYEGLTEVLIAEPQGLSVGKVLLSDGSQVLGVIGEPELVKDKKEISQYGGWRNYLMHIK